MKLTSVLLNFFFLVLISSTGLCVQQDFSYDASGKLKSANYDDVNIQYSYDSNGNLKERTSTGINQPPSITSFSANVTSGNAPLSVAFICQATDQDGIIAEYQFDFDGDGINDLTGNHSGQASYTYSSTGTFSASCTALDDKGASVTSIPITITVTTKSWQDIIDQLNVTSSRRQLYDRFNRCFFIQVTIENQGNALSGPIRMVITDPSIPIKTGVGVGLVPDGYTPDGDPYFELIHEGESLGTGQVLDRLRVNFELQRRRLTYGIRIEQYK